MTGLAAASKDDLVLEWFNAPLRRSPEWSVSGWPQTCRPHHRGPITGGLSGGRNIIAGAPSPISMGTEPSMAFAIDAVLSSP